MRRRLLLVALVLVSLPVLGQQPPQPPRLTWLRHYQVQPGKEADFVQLVNGTSKALFDRLMAEKQVVGWGVAVPLTHTGEPWTHVVYVGLPNWQAAEALVTAIEANDAAMSRADQVRFAALAASSIQPYSVRDVILRHLSQSDTPPSAKPKYISVDTYTVKPGREADALALFNEWAKPMFTATGANGKLGPWGFSMQDQTGDYTHMVWFFLSELSALDENDAAMMRLDPIKLRGFDVRLRDLSEPEKHRSQLLRVVQSAP